MADGEEGGVVDQQSPDLHKDQIWSRFSTSFRALRRWAPATVFLFFILLVTGALFFWNFDYSYFMIESPLDSSPHPFPFPFKVNSQFSPPPNKTVESLAPRPPRKSIEYPLNCSNEAAARTCTTNYPLTFDPDEESPPTCPDYFRWIYEDLRPWNATGISRDALERAREFAHFRLVVYKGKAYLDTVHRAWQTRDVFTIWGIVQLLRLYPGRVPDLELMFRCEDRPLIQKRDYRGHHAKSPPVLFQYCGNDKAVGVVFPDWSYWGWVEVNIKPWKSMLEGIIEGSKRTKWKDRVPYAYWRGNPDVSPKRKDLMSCNDSRRHDWNARLYKQDWQIETEDGFKNSNLEDQCTHRYKIYIEGIGWSVSDKYILACDAMNLLVKPEYYDFFLRGMFPMLHYFPIRPNNKCRDIKFAVDWGNSNSDDAEALGKAGSDYIRENVNMDFVYDYMFHLLSEYSKLLKFEPKVPEGAVEICAESMACAEGGLVRSFMEESMVKSPSDTLPCAMPPAYTSSELQSVLREKERVENVMERWKNEFYRKNRKH